MAGKPECYSGLGGTQIGRGCTACFPYLGAKSVIFPALLRPGDCFSKAPKSERMNCAVSSTSVDILVML